MVLVQQKALLLKLVQFVMELGKVGLLSVLLLELFRPHTLVKNVTEQAL